MRSHDDPALREILMEAEARVHKIANRDRQSDRDAVLKAICEQGCRAKWEIKEETGLSDWTVRGILEEFVMNDLVKIQEKYYPEGRPEGEPELEYHPL